MRELTEKSIIILLCATLLFGSADFVSPVAALLSVIACTSLLQAFDNRVFNYVLSAAFIAACFKAEVLLIFIPVLIYDLCRRKLPVMLAASAFPIAVNFYNTGNLRLFVSIIIFSLVAAALENLDRQTDTLSRELIITRDNAVERNNKLNSINSQLLEAQDKEVHMATLKERNRIAREIHDNVGHMLTRTILQMGALKIINKDPELKEPLDSVKETLDEAMNSIRKSVHDLHDDSVDLIAEAEKAIEPLNEKFSVVFEHDISDEFDGKVKYCFIAIIKEAVNNTIKHSNGDRVHISLLEHPAMYTLSFSDNGRCSTPGDSGIGLVNMRERVQALNGTINITAGNNGFKVFVSIMKNTVVK